MTKQGLLGAFGTHAFLDGLSDQHLMRLGSAVKPFAAGPTEVLARKGHGANAFYLIQSGLSKSATTTMGCISTVMTETEVDKLAEETATVLHGMKREGVFDPSWGAANNDRLIQNG